MPATADLDALRERAIPIALEAGALLMEGFRGEPGARSKSRNDLVTEYDERCEAQLRDRLAGAFPGAAIVGEEAGGRADAERVWYVDPIDGTNNYAHGHPWFCLSMGLWEGGEPKLGVVHAPAMGLTYAAARGHGLRRNGSPARVSEVGALQQALLATGFASDPRERAVDNYPTFATLDPATHGVRRCASAALELSVVADGGYDGFWDEGLAPWDVAAGALFVLEAGGRLSDLEGGPFVLDGGSIVATNGSLHEELLNALAHARALPGMAQMP